MSQENANAELHGNALAEARAVLDAVKEVRSRFSAPRLAELASETNGRLSLIGAQIVVALAVQPTQSAAELGRLLSVQREGCSSAISELRGSGLVETVFDSADHVGNHNAVRLTEQGVKAARALSE